MKYSEFNYRFEFDGKEGVFNTFSGAIIVFESNNENVFNNSVGDLDFNTLEAYKRAGIVVDDFVDERKILNNNRQDFIDRKSIPIFRILTTYKCNANCFYCYEDKKQNISMQTCLSESIIEFIKKHIGIDNSVKIQWFGGEPLLNHSIITIINQALRQNNIKVFNSIISNGSLFSKEIIRMAKKEWDLKNVQITLDGLGIVHEKRKNYYNFPNSFEQTINVIQQLVENEIKVSIRINYDSLNIDSVYHIINYLANKFSNNRFIFCYAHH